MLPYLVDDYSIVDNILVDYYYCYYWTLKPFFDVYKEQLNNENNFNSATTMEDGRDFEIETRSLGIKTRCSFLNVFYCWGVLLIFQPPHGINEEL